MYRGLSFVHVVTRRDVSTFAQRGTESGSMSASIQQSMRHTSNSGVSKVVTFLPPPTLQCCLLAAGSAGPLARAACVVRLSQGASVHHQHHLPGPHHLDDAQRGAQPAVPGNGTHVTGKITEKRTGFPRGSMAVCSSESLCDLRSHPPSAPLHAYSRPPLAPLIGIA